MALSVIGLFWIACVAHRYKMKKKRLFGVCVLIGVFCIQPKLESRQYNVNYLMELIEAGNEEGIHNFFSQPNYVTKIKHIVEFTEIFCSKLEERFGYKPSYKEAYKRIFIRPSWE